MLEQVLRHRQNQVKGNMIQKTRSYTISNVKLDRDDKGVVEISWQTDKDVTNLGLSIYVGDSPDAIGRKHPTVRVKGKTSAKIPILDPYVRHYFELVPEGSPGVIASERRVPLKGAVNFRDLGGYETSDGRRLKWGQVFRSDHLSRLSKTDRNIIRRMGVQLVCDFRTPAEVKVAPDRLQANVSMEYLHLPITNSVLDPVDANERIKQGDLSWLTMEFLVKGYIENLETFAPVWCTVFHRLADPLNRPLVFHCTGGKDRTGVGAALVLLVLGVSEETVIYDHGLSDGFNAERLREIRKRIESYGVEPEKVDPYLKAPRALIVTLLGHIREKYGSAENYLKTKAGVDDATVARLKKDLIV